MSGSKTKDDKKLKDNLKKLTAGIDDMLKEAANLAKMKKELGGSELSEMESQKLQMAMDRLSKLLETISNITRKVSSTHNEIVKNMK